MTSRLIDFIFVEENDQDFTSFKQAFDEFKFEGRLLRLRCLPELVKFFENPSRAELSNFKPRLIFVAASGFQESIREFLDGRKEHPYFRKIPLIVMVDSGPEAPDKRPFYEHGANSVVLKPKDPNGYVNLVENIGKYWFGVVMLPTVE